MKTDSTPAPLPEPAYPTGEATAAAYLAQELPKARQTLKRTRIIGIILILFVGVYVGVICTMMVNFLQPKAAAEIAGGMLYQHITREGPILAAQVEKEIPRLIRQVPDYIIAEMPGYRKDLQQMLETESQNRCAVFSQDLGKRVDQLIDAHRSEIRTLLENANDRDAIRKTLPDFDRVIAECLKNDVEGQALRGRIDEWAVVLKEVETRMDRLAHAKNLSSEEQKARHTLALLSKVIEDNTKLPEGATVPAPEAKAKFKLSPR